MMTMQRLLASSKFFSSWITVCFFCIGWMSKASAELGILQDNEAPQLVDVVIINDQIINLFFSETLDPVSANQASNYVLDSGIEILAVFGFNQVVQLQISSLFPGDRYTLTLNGLSDIAGNLIAVDTTFSFNYGERVYSRFQNGIFPDVDYDGASDTYIASGLPDNNFGMAQDVLADGSDGGRGQLMSLLKWDLADVPSNAIITHATIELAVFNRSGGSYGLYALHQAWDESSATWNNYPALDIYGARVGRIEKKSKEKTLIRLNEDGVTMVQNWISGQTNDGVLIKTDGTNDGIDFYSSESDNIELRPKLHLSYIVAPGANQPPAASFFDSVFDLTAVFVDSSTDADGSVSSWLWEFGDGETSTVQDPIHEYQQTGIYTVRLTVTDDDGVRSSTVRRVRVINPDDPIRIVFQQGRDGYRGAEDTFVSEKKSRYNFGCEEELLADEKDKKKGRLISFLKFDVSQIPQGAEVVAAKLKIKIYDTSHGRYKIRAVHKAWREEDATWDNTRPRHHRGEIIGYFYPDETGYLSIPLNAEGLSLVQSWVDGASNQGFSIRSDGSEDGVDFYSKDTRKTHYRPSLLIDYKL